jgi:cell division protein FtsI/penicillin-binding protein 2
MTSFPSRLPAHGGHSRLALLACLLILALVAVEWRLVHLQVLRHAELEEKAEEYRHIVRQEQSWRGEIRDAAGQPLALTVPVKDVFADLGVWTNRVESLATTVAPLLGVDATSLARRVNQSLKDGSESADDGRARVLLLKRGVPLTEWNAIQAALNRQTFGLPASQHSSRQRALLKSLRRWTLFAVDDQRRYYPCGETLASVLGFVGTGTNGHLLQGRWGLEASLDTLLAGQNGVCDSSQDAAGNEMAFCRTTDLAPRNGSQVVLTINLGLQRVVEQALAKVCARYHPSNASCVVIRPATGEILALASLPTFAPQNPGDGPPANWRNHVISDRYEVGSVFKVITLATALDRGVVTLNQPIFCENGHWTYKNLPLRDDDHHFGTMPVRECLARSSNIAFAKIGLMVGVNGLYDSMLRFGFAQPTGVPLPYETGGFIRPPAAWTPVSITRVAIGHEVAVSQMQLAMAYAALANDGTLMRPMLVKQVNHADGSLWGKNDPHVAGRVVRPETARQVREAMVEVVDHGTGEPAALPGYSVAGKTGTAQKSDGHRFLPGRYYCSFIGMIPAGKPELVIAVAVDDPGSTAYGGTVAAPVFREIAEQAVAMYGIHPDRPVVPARSASVVRRTNSDVRLMAFAR